MGSVSSLEENRNLLNRFITFKKRYGACISFQYFVKKEWLNVFIKDVSKRQLMFLNRYYMYPLTFYLTWILRSLFLERIYRFMNFLKCFRYCTLLYMFLNFFF